MTIDAHTHIGTLPGSPKKESLEENFVLLLKEARENNVDHLIVIAGLGHSNDRTASILDVVSGHQNVHVIAGVNIAYSSEYLEQLEDWVKTKQIVGVKFYTGYQHFYPSDKRCAPIYDIALRHNIPVIFHSGDTLANYVKNPKVKYSHPLHIDEVAADYPDLKIVIAHMGNPWLVDCAELLYKNPNVYADISGLIVGEDLNTPYGELMKKRIKEMVDYIGPEHKLLYGTDYPVASMNAYLEFARSLELSPEGKDNLFFKNALRVFTI